MTYCGIYKIVNEKTGQVYVGQSTDIAYRWKDHLKLEDSVDIHQGLQQDVCQFSFQIIELCPEEKLDERERFWISHYNSYLNGYNMTPGGKTTIAAYTERARPVEQYDLFGNHIYTFASIAEARKSTGIGHIDQCCRGERQTAGGYQWKYVSPKTNEVNKVSSNAIPQIRTIVQYTMDGKEIKKYSTVAEAAKEVNVSPSLISKVLAKKGISAAGFRWGYDGENIEIVEPKAGVKRKVAQLSKDTQEIIAVYESLSEATKAFNKKSVSTISDAAKGKTKTAYGYCWKFIEE